MTVSMSTTKPIKVAILGSTGMLGSMVFRYLSQQPGLILRPTERSSFDAAKAELSNMVEVLDGQDYAINCIGVIKPRIDALSSSSVERAIQVNSLFPHRLAVAAKETGTRVLQIATDCVYSGIGASANRYNEHSLHDSTDIYGQTKSLGEVFSSQVRHLRCSIVGPEGAGRPCDSLLEWFLSRPSGAIVHGFSNHRWNGVTTLAFARLVGGIMREGLWGFLSPVQHIVPNYWATKYELLSYFARWYNRESVSVVSGASAVAIDRVLVTRFPAINIQVWGAAGYAAPPTISGMIQEMAAYGKEASKEAQPCAS
jgi:dTDP-4-dehydrorhamnose reductase